MSDKGKRTDGEPLPSVLKIAVVELADEDNGWLSSEALRHFAANVPLVPDDEEHKPS